MNPRQKDKIVTGILIVVAAVLIISFVAYIFWGFINHI